MALQAPERETRKTVTVLFCDVTGSTALGESTDPEALRALLARYFERMKQIVESHGGTVEKFIGDAVMAVFGIPAAHEDDAERAVRAGLAIVEAIEELNRLDPSMDLAVRLGINTGEVLVNLGATGVEGEVLGDAVNTASRLQGIAPVNALAVSEPTFRATERVFEWERLEPAAVKGKSEPLALWRPVKARARLGSDVVRTQTTPLVGRDLERTLLVGTFERADQQATCQLVSIVGEPGVGKSRLCSELLGHVAERPGLVRWRQGRCLPYGNGILFWALGEIVKAKCEHPRIGHAGAGGREARAGGCGGRSGSRLAACATCAVGRDAGGARFAGGVIRRLAALLRGPRRRADDGARVRGPALGRCRPARFP